MGKIGKNIGTIPKGMVEWHMVWKTIGKWIAVGQTMERFEGMVPIDLIRAHQVYSASRSFARNRPIFEKKTCLNPQIIQTSFLEC